MSSKFNLSAALAISGAAFFAGSLITLYMVSVTPRPAYTEAQVTRAATPALTQAPIQAPALAQPAPQAVAIPSPAPSPQIALPATDGLSQQDASALLAALTQSTQAPAARGTNGVRTQSQASAPNLDIMRAAANTYRARGGAQNLDEAIKRNAVSDLDRGRQTIEIHDLLNNAARNGLIQVPAGLTSADGSVDTRTLLFDIVNRAVSENAIPVTKRRIAATPQAATAVQPVAVATQPALRPNFYTVEQGDSLAFIALQFFGSTSEYRRIYNANRDVLSNPDRISVGQRLRIPAS